MKLIIIYGPPAVGKLTVAKELAKITGYKILHNNLTVNLVTSIFEFRTEDFREINRKIILFLFEAAAKKEIDGIVFTFCYDKNISNNFIKKVMQKIEDYQGEIFFVQLTTNKDKLIERVKLEPRKRYGKLKTIKGLKKFLKKGELTSSVPFKPNLKIDNTKLPAKKVAQKIKEHYKL